LKAPVTKRLEVKYDDLPSILLHFCFNFAFNFDLRRYTLAKQAEENSDRKKFDGHAPKVRRCKSRGEPFLTQKHTLNTPNTP